MNFALGLVSNKIYGTSVDIARLTGNPLSTDTDPYEAQLKLEQVLLDGEVSPQTHNTIQEKVATPSASSTVLQQSSVNSIAALLLGSPEFQRR